MTRSKILKEGGKVGSIRGVVTKAKIVVVGRYIFRQRTSKKGDSRSMSLAIGVFMFQ